MNKTILDIIPSYLFSLLTRKHEDHNLHSMDVVPKLRHDLGKKTLGLLVPNAWNKLQSELQLEALVILNVVYCF